MASMRQNLIMIVALAFFALFLPSMASPLLSRSDLVATGSALDIAMPTSVAATNFSMPFSMTQAREEKEPARLPSSLTDNMYCEPTPSKCAQESGRECQNEWYWDVHKSWVNESAKAFCEQVAKDLNGIDNSVGKHFHYFQHDKIVTNTDSTYATFWIGIEDAKVCKSNNIDRYPYTPVDGHDCLGVIYGAWRQCDNKGQGGAVEAGCIRFSIKPAKPGPKDLEIWIKSPPT